MTSTETATKATITAAAFREILTRVEPHMNREDFHPGIAGIRLEGTGRHLIAVATDRYTMAVARTPLRSDDGPWRATIPGTRVKSLSQWLKAQGRTANVHIRPSGDTISFTSPDGELAMSVEVSGFPKWRPMLAKMLAEDPQPVPLSAFTTEYLGRWAGAGHILSVSQAGSGRPLILFGDDFLGLQMPASLRDGSDRAKAVGEWAVELGPAGDGPAELPQPDPSGAIPAMAERLLRQVVISSEDLFEAPMDDHVAADAHARASVQAWTAYRLLQALEKVDPRRAEKAIAAINWQLEAGDFAELAHVHAEAAGHDPAAWAFQHRAARAKRAQQDAKDAVEQAPVPS